MDDRLKQFREALAKANEGAGIQEGPSFDERLEQSKQIMNEPDDPERNAALQALSRIGRSGLNLLPQDSMTLPGGQKFDPTGALGSVKSLGFERIPSAAHGDIIKNVLGDVQDAAKSEQLAEAMKKLGYSSSKDIGSGRTIISDIPKVNLGKVKVQY